MDGRLVTTLAFFSLSVATGISAASDAPFSYIRAQTALGFNPKSRCPDLRIAEEGTMATVAFRLSSSGNPSKISIKASSGSNALDSAAMSCVAKLRFAAATQLGDGTPIDSWQQIDFGWARQGNAGETPATPTEVGRSSGSGDADSVTVHVCADATGRPEKDPTIVHSSGVPSLDQAALKIAASGAPYYRPATASNRQPVSGCVQLAIKFDTQP